MGDAKRAGTRRSAADTREHVLEVAHELFYWKGIRATGVDEVARSAGVAPTTLYRLFASKDDLVAGYVERSCGLYREWFEATLAAAASDPRSRILGLFEAQVEQVQPAVCRGCPFAMALAELPDPDLPAHRHAVACRAWVLERFRALTNDLADAAPVGDPEALADRLMLVFEGVYATVTSLGADGPATQATALAQALLPPTGPTSPS